MSKMWKRHLRIAFSYLFLLLQLKFLLVETVNETIPVNVGLVIDFEDWIGKVGLSCFDVALKDFYGTHVYYKTRLVLNIRDSKRDVVAAASAALDQITNIQVEAIIGPTTSTQANFITQLGEKAKVPIISFSASNPSLTTIRSPYFFQATPNDSAQVNAISAIIKAFGWREAVLVYVDDEYGVGIIPYLTDALQAVDTQVPYRSAISPLATDSQIIEKLYKLKEMRSRVFVVHMLPDLGSRLFINAKKIGMMGKGYVWIITYRMTDFLDSMDSFVIESMQGVLGIKPHVPMEKLKNFQVQWQRKFHQDNPEKDDAKLNMYGLWAYDATIALAMTVENVSTRTKNFDFEKSGFSSNSTTDLETIGVSQIGLNLRQALSDISFRGLTGDFQFVDGQLKSSAFQIVNVNGDRATRETALVPKGWETPTDGKKLRIGVPVKEGFMQFVNVTIDPITNTSSVKGFSIDLFDAVVKELPYSLLYEYIPFANPNGKSAGSYNDLVYQVHLGKFDAVVGYISIVANRSQYVDFTLPYTGAGTVSMIVPTTDEEIWVLEHRINEEFQGSPSQQVGTSFWFSFSTMVFAHRERVESNLARIVVIIWCFVALVLTQSYAASLSSFLTMEQLRPSVTTIDELIANGENVGYQNGSFVKGVLRILGFKESKLVPYKSAEECNDLLSKGSKNRGIAAAFDESPSTKLIMAQICSIYTLVETTSTLESQLRTDGRGFVGLPSLSPPPFSFFVFPRGSPLTADVSRAILKVIVGEKGKEIEEKWFGKQLTCPYSSNSVPSSRLGLNSFWGLFLIAGVASLLSLIIYMAMFIHKNRGILITSDSNASLWSRILELLRIFKQKDFRSHTCRKSDENEPSSSTYAMDTDFLEEQRTSSPESQEAALNIEFCYPSQEQSMEIELENN
ncbi:hypothetical protein JCGZ_05390 [Jatropha curcas]|uniref:Glutamate receptor n=1 Tax=Jatropha curcas TaxID=180498 RepID=A0A067L9K9_JATCU|nr:hypothetical protein JCGZ_05390 [Jatropha curcas]